MKWIENENSENYLVGYSNEDQAYAVIKKKETINGTKLQLHIGSNKTFVPIPLCVDPEKISMEMVQGWFSLEQPKLLGRDAEGNEISVALVPNQIRWYINGYLFILINGCDKWSLNRNLDPLNLSLEEAISEISKNKKKIRFQDFKTI